MVHTVHVTFGHEHKYMYNYNAKEWLPFPDPIFRAHKVNQSIFNKFADSKMVS